MTQFRMLRLTPGVLLLSLVASLKCPDQQHCGDEQTCCQIQSGEFNCCPFQQGECCEDHFHCCPEGMLCEVKESRCTNTTHLLPWAERFPSEPTSLVKSFRMISSSDANNMFDTICPDNSLCPSEFSCLKVSDTYGCCPVAQGVVCSDGKHCCPKDQECTAEGTYCVKKKVTDVPCDDTTGCPDGTTCCKTEEGGWACCPLLEAVCCDDFIHCCPHGKKCNLTAQSCDDPSGSVPWLKKNPSRPIGGQKLLETKVTDVPCDDTTGCPDGTTCCKTEEGGWACCPLLEAVCCDDFIHCCPHDKKCNLTAQSCDDPSGSVPWLKKNPSRPIGGQTLLETKVTDVPCDDTTGCPDGTTCCKTKEGGWACCPLLEAVCCDDFIHCCPHGKKCNLTAQSCDDPSGSVPWLKKNPSRPIGGQKLSETKVTDVPCDDTTGCPDGTTCCKTKEGGWACCPLLEAVCCDDFIHCCPHGKKCNLTAQSCDDPSGSVPWLKKNPSRPIGGQKLLETKVTDVPCDDIMGCPDGTTCCKTEEGGWACCPLPAAVCCEDLIHCCPHGKKCNLPLRSCDDASGSVPWMKKEQSQPISGQKVLETNVSDVPCDDTTGCPDGTTCCKTQAGKWACCPLPEAVCCEDFIHCCPKDTKCNLAEQSCDKPSESVPWMKKEPSRPIGEKNFPENKGSAVPCNDSVACPDGNTCCKDKQGEWACCPLVEAVCCDDLIHCCPHGKKCNPTGDSCDDPSGSVPWLKQETSQASTTTAQNASDVSVNCDTQTSCPDHTTCCLMKTSQWGCCPLEQATCCADGENCCPKGYTCRNQWCEKKSSLDFLPSFFVRDTAMLQIQTDIECGGAFSCSDSETCCRTSQNSWGCCSFPKAVCCSDMQHCCPAGYTCDDSGSCTPAMGLNWDVFVSRKKRAHAV